MQVIRWMTDPVPAPEYSLACPTPTDMVLPGGHLCMAPASGCIQVRRSSITQGEVHVCMIGALLSIDMHPGVPLHTSTVPCWAAPCLPLAHHSCHPSLFAGPHLQGSWNSTRCACDCLDQFNASVPGFCPDLATGVCSVVKQFDTATREFSCPETSADSSGDQSSSDSSSTHTSTASPAQLPSSSTSARQQANPAASPAAQQAGSTTANSGSSSANSEPLTESGLESILQSFTSAAPNTSVGSPSASAATSTAPTAASATHPAVADVQPLAGVQFAFDVQGELSSFIRSAQQVCDVVSALAGQPPSACSIASVTEAAAPGTSATRRLTSAGKAPQPHA